VTGKDPEGYGAAPISLALVTRNQADYLRRFLANYLAFGAGRIALTVVDDGSDDATPALLAALPREAGIRVHTLPHGTIARARNHALRHSPTPWLAFSDTDCILGRDYFDALPGIPGLFPEAAAVEGAVHAPPGPRPLFAHSVINRRGGFFATANMAFRVASVLALGGFDEVSFGNYREDTDLAMTLIEKHGPIPFLPGWKVVHPHIPRRLIPALRGAFAAQERIIEAEIRLFRKHPRTYALARARGDARSTLAAWACKHSAVILKECLTRVLADRGIGARDRLRALGLMPRAMAVALWEHGCIVLHCMVRWREIARLKSP
jgi:glycosyltransferase involved in cell wall biosynthesis